MASAKAQNTALQTKLVSEGEKLALSEGEVDTLKEKLDATRQLIANLEEELTNHKEDAESREEVSLQYSFV